MKKIFDPNYFQKFNFTGEQIRKYWGNALRDLEIAKKDSITEVKFTYSYSALLKAGITLLAKHGIKVRSIPGHHVKVLEKLRELLGDSRIMAVGDAMRAKRNADLYGGGVYITEKEAKDFLAFVSDVFTQVTKWI